MEEQQQRVFVRAHAGRKTIWMDQIRSPGDAQQLTTASTASAGSFSLLPSSCSRAGVPMVSLADVWPSPLFSGKGRGRQVIAVARTADVVIMMLDATKGEVQR